MLLTFLHTQGMKLAKLEIKMALCYFVSFLDLTPVDAAGHAFTRVEDLPLPPGFTHDRRPTKPLFLQYQRRK